ncbi:MAG: hypothetical protein M3O80_03695 [Chloroflexota bacterium]|nr:hypothetical protein [Chloroflexota bacterium]
MRRHRDGGIDDLVRNTIIWIAIVIWLVWGYISQAPPTDAYDDSVRRAFTIVLAVVIPFFSAMVIVAWVGTLRQRQKR